MPLTSMPPLDALERVERRLDLLVRQAAMFRRADDRQRVADIQFADEVQMKLEAGNFKLRRRRAVAEVEGMNRVVRRRGRIFSPGNA